MSSSQPNTPDVDPIGSAVSGSRVARMTGHEIAYMLAAAARIPQVFQSARAYLAPTLFHPTEAGYTLFWRSLVTAAEGAESQGGTLPGDPNAARELVAVYCAKEVASDVGKRFYTPSVERTVLDPGGLLDEVYALPITEETIGTAYDLLTRFVNERKLFDPVQQAFAGVTSHQTLKDPQAIFALIEAHARDMAGMAHDPGSDAVVDRDDFIPPAPLLIPTGCKWLDAQLGGGAARKEAYVVLGPTSGGKCFAAGTEVMMSDGSVKAVEDVTVGDRVMGPDGRPRTVLCLARGREEMYEIRGVSRSPDEPAASYVVNASHTLSVKVSPTQSGDAHTVVNLEVRDYLNRSKTFQHRAKGYRAAIDFPAVDVPIDPYFLGLWLADGSLGKPEITKPDPEVREYLSRFAAGYGLEIHNRGGVNKTCPTWLLTSGRTGGKENPVSGALRAAGVFVDKHVPDVYRINSREVRLAILAGLFDGDANLKHCGTGYEFGSTLESVADAVVWICRSLGFRATKVARTTACQTGASCESFRVHVYGDCDAIPCLIARKKAKPRRKKNDVTVYGFTVIGRGEGDYYGFEVDGDHLFLLADFTVTHNSALGTQLAVDGADYQSSLVPDVGPFDAGHWYIFTWELNEAQLRERVYAYGARINLGRFKERDPRTRMPVFSTAERPETLHPYEHEPFVNSPGNPLMGERERLRALKNRMSGSNARLHIVDYSGEVPGHGLGGVPEVASYLRTQTARNKRRVAGVVIDYAGLVVNRYISGAKLRPDAEFSLLASFVDQARSRIALPFDCTVWVLHQLHGDVTKRPAGAQIHHSEARGCRNFADNSDFAFCLSPYNKATGLMTVSCTKHRRAAPMEGGAIVKFDGRFGAFRDPDQAYVVDPDTRQIVPRAYTGMVSPAAVGLSPPAQFGGGDYVDPRTIL